MKVNYADTKDTDDLNDETQRQLAITKFYEELWTSEWVEGVAEKLVHDFMLRKNLQFLSHLDIAKVWPINTQNPLGEQYINYYIIRETNIKEIIEAVISGRLTADKITYDGLTFDIPLQLSEIVNKLFSKLHYDERIIITIGHHAFNEWLSSSNIFVDENSLLQNWLKKEMTTSKDKVIQHNNSALKNKKPSKSTEILNRNNEWRNAFNDMAQSFKDKNNRLPSLQEAWIELVTNLPHGYCIEKKNVRNEIELLMPGQTSPLTYDNFKDRWKRYCDATL